MRKEEIALGVIELFDWSLARDFLLEKAERARKRKRRNQRLS